MRTRGRNLWTIFLGLALVAPAVATEYWVDGLHGNNANSGLSVALAKQTIQGALTVTNPGDTVYVLPATYITAFTLQDDNVTIEGLGEAVITTAMCSTNGKAGCVIRGLTFLDATSNLALQVDGGTTVERCRFQGGLIGLNPNTVNTPIVVRECTFSGYTSGGMGAASNMAVDRCTFANCATGLTVSSPGAVITNCSFAGNTTGMNYTGSLVGVTIYNCSFFGNTTDIPSTAAPYVRLTNCITSDPLFIDATANVFEVLSSSPLLTSGVNGDRIGARGAGFYSCTDATKNVPSQGSTPWAGWVDQTGNAIGDANSLAELNPENEIILKDGVTSAALYSPVFDTGSAYSVIRSVDFKAYQDLTLPVNQRQVIDYDVSTPAREIRLRVSSTVNFTQYPFQTATDVDILTVDKGRKLAERARYCQIELVLRNNGY